MDSQYYSPQQPGLVLGYPYVEDEDVQSSTTQSPSTSSLHSFSSTFDNHPPRSIPQQHFLPPTSLPPSNILLDQQFGYPSHIAMSQSPHQQWNSNLQSASTPNLLAQEQYRGEDMTFHPSSSYVTTTENDMFSSATIPRGWEDYHPRILHSQQNHGLPAFHSVNYGKNDARDHNMRHPQDHTLYQSLETGHDQQAMEMASPHDYAPGPSHYPSLESLKFNTKSAFSWGDDGTSNSGTASREMTAEDGDDHGIDEPYAKLIYRALMSKPDHSMVLQDIYQWFRENTNKGSSDSKGWMNSIRHNLSMNAVRTGHPSFSYPHR
jgi:hypothetical protein